MEYSNNELISIIIGIITWQQKQSATAKTVTNEQCNSTYNATQHPMRINAIIETLNDHGQIYAEDYLFATALDHCDILKIK